MCFLIGFFRASGFRHLWDLISPKIAQFQSIRILVGLNADLQTAELSTLADDLARNPHLQDEIFAKFKSSFAHAQAEHFATAPYCASSEDSFELLITALKEARLQIRIIKDKPTHAKFYIFSTEPTKSHTGQTNYNGSLIVGSSNLSQNGLYKNYEFNLESRDSDDIAYALFEFEALWEKSIPLTSDDADKLETTIKERTYLKECTPKEIYYKLLIEYFGLAKIKVDSTLKSFFPRGFKKPDYQLTAIAEGLDKLEKYNGFFLSDVVGLGKTLIASIIAKKFESEDEHFKTLVVCPAALKANWEEHLELVRLNHRKVISYDMLEKQIKNPSEYSLVIIDESHNLAHPNTGRYEALQNITKTPSPKNARKKVILLSATPQKNSPQDIESQLCLFQDKIACNIEDIDNLEAFFAPLKSDFAKIKKELESAFSKNDLDEINAQKAQLQEISQRIKEQLLRFVMVRRTRADISSIESFARNLAEQHIVFPQILPPKELLYDLGKDAHALALNTLHLLNEQDNSIGNFGYFRYLIYPNLNENGKAKFEKQYGRSNFTQKAQSLAGLIKIVMFKRFESSIEAFKATLQAQITSLQAFLKMFNQGKIAIPKYLSNLYKFYDDILSDEGSEKIAQYLDKDKAFILQKEDFAPSYEANLKSDLATLQTLLAKWQEIHTDPKLDELKSTLQDFFSAQANEKIIIFTEAKATADYLESKLKSHKVLKIDASNREANAQTIRENFDANYESKKDDFHILITTDTLAEGVNLHRSHIIINYDSPWSATNLMQRIGRINRIGTPHKEIHIYNFKPSNLGDAILGFNAKAFQKLQSFHFTFGEDSAIYDSSEEFGTQKLFSDTIYKEQDEISEDTEFLNDIKKLYANSPDEFARIHALKPKSRTFITDTPQCFCYMKNPSGNNYFYKIESADSNKAQKSDFFTMARYLKSRISTKPTKTTKSQITQHYSDIEHILEFHNSQFSAQSKDTLFEIPTTTKDPKVQKARTKVLNAMEFLSEAQIDIIVRVLDMGILANLYKDIISAKSKEDFTHIYQKCQAKLPSHNPAPSTEDKTPQIQLSISSFPHKDSHDSSLRTSKTTQAIHTPSLRDFAKQNRGNQKISPSLARGDSKSSPSLAEVESTCSPSLAEGARGWVDSHTSSLQASEASVAIQTESSSQDLPMANRGNQKSCHTELSQESEVSQTPQNRDISAFPKPQYDKSRDISPNLQYDKN
ncbi:helicase-related protein [Helicobacter sp. T3_23-1056]